MAGAAAQRRDAVVLEAREHHHGALRPAPVGQVGEIGLVQVGNRLEQAVVYDPSRNDLFCATRGRGAYLNDRRIRVAKRTMLRDTLISTGFPFRPGDSFQTYMKMLTEVMPKCAGVRRPGSAALDLAYVAAGFSDGFFEMGLSPWDVAAGALLVT